jgi:hypothetical protein
MVGQNQENVSRIFVENFEINCKGRDIFLKNIFYYLKGTYND